MMAMPEEAYIDVCYSHTGNLETFGRRQIKHTHLAQDLLLALGFPH